MKKVLILTASTGDGHNQAAESLLDVFAANNYSAIKYDFLKSSSQFWNTFVVVGYKLLAVKFPILYGGIYRFTNHNIFNRMIPSILIRKVEKGLIAEINKHNPDVIIGTHAFAVTVVSKLKKRRQIDIPFVSIITDFQAHGGYIDDEVDAYICGSEHTKQGMIERKVPQDKIFPFGIPVRKDFLYNTKYKNKLPGEYFSVLLMGGGMGLKFIAPVLKRLIENEHKLNIVVVCGNNKSLKEALDKEYNREIINKKINIIGFTKNIPDLMNEADVIITKPGGLTVTEAITKRLPMLLPYAIRGQEQENMSFLFDSGAAVDVRKLQNFNDVLNSLIEHPEKLQEMRNSLDNIFRAYSTEGIVELANSLTHQNKRFEYYEGKLIRAAH